MRFRPLPSAPGCRLRARPVRRGRARRGPALSCRRRMRDACDDQFAGRPRSRGEAAAGVELGERALGLVEAADQQQAPDLEIARMRGIDPGRHALRGSPVAASSAFRGPGKIARDEGDLGLGDDTSRARHRLLWGRRHARHARAGPSPGRDRRAAPSRCPEARAQPRRRAGPPVSGAERITGGERTRRGGDQRVHRNPATLVTPTIRFSVLTSSRSPTWI
jgi:hypothetical protein